MLFRSEKSEKDKNTVIRSKKEGDIYSILKKAAKPVKKKQSKDEKINLKEILLQEIVDNNIWTDDDLDALFERTKETYQDIDEKEIKEAILFVKNTIF